MFSSQGCQCVINVLKELADWACVQTLCPLAVTSHQPCDPVKEMLFIIPLPHSKEIRGKEVGPLAQLMKWRGQSLTSVLII